MSNRESVFIGVDLGTSLLRKSTGIAYLVEKNGAPWMESLPLHIPSDDAQIHSWLTKMSENFSLKIIAIDAPLSLPLPEHGTMRKCERKLLNEGIPCFPSGAGFTKDWVNKAIRLEGWAKTQLNAKVIEVYPFAARVRLEIGADEKKKTSKGRQKIQDGLLSLIGGLNNITKERKNSLHHDELDAILSAYTAYCEGIRKAEKISGDDGTIYVPMRLHNHTLNEY